MRRWLGITALIAVALAGTLRVGNAAEHHRGAAAICQQKATGPDGVKALIKCAAPKLGVSTSKALYVAWRESHYKPWARNSSSSACGVYQFISGTWSYVVRTYLYGHLLGPIYCENGRMNVFLALRYVRHGGWGPWGG